MISVVIPAYNCQDTIIKALDSIKKQTRFDLIKEIIIVNDGSTDETEKVIKSYIISNKSMPINLISQENKGVSCARNIGIDRSSQKWIALLDADDIWLPNKIEVQVQVLKFKPNIYFLGSNRNNEKVKLGKLVDKQFMIRHISTKQLLFKSWPSVPTVIFDKEFIDGLNRFNCEIGYGEDADLWLRVARKGQLYYIEESLVQTGNGKRSFGVSGLSSNLYAMHQGVLMMINNAYKEKDIGLISKFIYLGYEQIKYLRRKIITNWSKSNEI